MFIYVEVEGVEGPAEMVEGGEGVAKMVDGGEGVAEAEMVKGVSGGIYLKLRVLK
ncbi:UNVERIFIED_CONTAM: hypothetical protein Sindi_0027800, partial [Sesamum indicum]